MAWHRLKACASPLAKSQVLPTGVFDSWIAGRIGIGCSTACLALYCITDSGKDSKWWRVVSSYTNIFKGETNLIEQLFDGPFERMLSRLFMITTRYRGFIARSPSVSSAFYMLVAGAKFIFGSEVMSKYKSDREGLKSRAEDRLRTAIDSKAFATSLFRLAEDKAISTNEAGRLSLVKFGIAYALELVAQQRYALLDLGSSAGLHLLWDEMTVRYETASSLGRILNQEHALDYLSTADCKILDATYIPCFIDSWIPPEATLAVDEKLICLENAADLEWLSALTPVQNKLRQARLRWAIEQRRKSPLHFFQADVTDDLASATNRLPNSLPLIIIHTFMTTGWDTKKHAIFAKQLATISDKKPFFEVAVELKSYSASVLQVTHWAAKDRKVILSIPCDPQGQWIQTIPYSTSNANVCVAGKGVIHS